MSFRNYAASLVILWLSWPSAVLGDETNVDQAALCNSADQSIELDKKIRACDVVIASHSLHASELAIVYNSRGLWRLYQRAYETAIADFGAAIENDRNYDFAYNNRGLVYRLLGRFEDAVMDFDRANRRDESPDHYVNLAETFAYIGDRQKVLANLDMASKMAPNSLELYYASCFSMAILGDQAGPVADCDKAVSAAPHDPNVFDVRGYASQRAGNNDAAVRDYSEALKMNPQLDTSLFGRGVALLALGNIAEGRSDIEKARQLNPSIDAQMKLAKVAVPDSY